MTHQHTGYGFFPGGDPRSFTPDEQGTTDEEREAHNIACDAAEKGALGLEGSCVHGPGVSILRSMFGLGVYSYDCDDASCTEHEDPDEPIAQEDGPAHFAVWWAKGGAVMSEFDTHPQRVKPETLRDLMSEAFLAGFRARESDPPPARVQGEARS